MTCVQLSTTRHLAGIRGAIGSLVLAVATAAAAASPSPAANTPPPPAASLADLFATMRRDPNDLATLANLKSVTPRLSAAEADAGMQLLATAESLVGNYGAAARAFPQGKPAQTRAPEGSDWKATDAAEFVVKAAANQRIVMINEAHHDATTRTLTLAILKGMRANGFDFLAVEALPEHSDIQKRGYPVRTHGGLVYYYEPVYAEMLRQAVALGFTLVPYDYGFNDSDGVAEREIAEAHNITRQVFATHPGARLLVHAGWDHVNHAMPERLATQLEKETGLRALTIDQTRLRDHPGVHDPLYETLLARFHPHDAVVIQRQGAAYSADPASYDISILRPRLLPGDGRGEWLRLGGGRWPESVDASLCANAMPCMIEARREGEDTNAVPADRVVLDHAGARGNLFLYPGIYRVEAQAVAGARRWVGQWTVGPDGKITQAAPH